MPDPYYDKLAGLALELDDVWLDGRHSTPGVHLESTRDLNEVAEELVTVYRAAGYRTSLKRAVGEPRAQVTVTNLIDRQCWVIVRPKAQTG